jgi:radical SAM superfamily enzyme YgiQ (UPF0313 family)
MTEKPTRALLIHPYFYGSSFWNYRAACEVLGAKYPSAPLGLITLAAMLPEDWDIRLVDRNTGELTDDDLAWADVAMIGSMLPQAFDALKLIKRCQDFGLPVVVGGPDPTSRPEIYEAADFAVLGEVEGSLQAFLDDWRAGAKSGCYVAPKFTIDVTQTPTPRYDLLKFEDYTYIGVQFSLRCLFLCEFCDIIELYGRVPRTKGFDQILRELDRLYELGYRGHVDFVDDNLIGNKKAVKEFLPLLAEWQKARDYPFAFSTEASLNLADDDDFLGLMKDAGFFIVFIGIESPDDEVLKATRKKQNSKRDIADNVNKIYDYGIMVIAGFIVGFDTEKNNVARATTRLIEDASIGVAMVGLLYALPNTQLSRRLTKEGRLHELQFTPEDGIPEGDQCTAGLNFETRRPREEILQDYREILRNIYSAQAFFGRVERAALALKIPRRGRLFVLPTARRDLARFFRLVKAMTFDLSEARPYFWRMFLCLLVRNPLALKSAMNMVALFIHLGPFSRFVMSEIDTQIIAIQDGSAPTPILVRPGANTESATLPEQYRRKVAAR